MREAELTGVRSGRIVAIEPTARRSNGKIVWLCRCDCGAEHCERLNLKYSTVHRRLTQGASVEDALKPGRAAYRAIKKSSH